MMTVEAIKQQFVDTKRPAGFSRVRLNGVSVGYLYDSGSFRPHVRLHPDEIAAIRAQLDVANVGPMPPEQSKVDAYIASLDEGEE